MSLFDELRPASFRGFAFDIPSDTVSVSKRIQTHQYPGKDEPFHENLGRNVRGFSVEAVVHGSDFVERAKELEELLLNNDEGILIHPYYGEVEVIVINHSRSHSADIVGQVNFSIRFEKYGAPLYPSAVTDTSSEILGASNSTFEKIAADFDARFITESVPEFVTLDALNRLETFNTALNDVLNATNTVQEWAISDISNVSTKALATFNFIANFARPVTASLISLRSLSVESVAAPISLIRMLMSSLNTPLSDDRSATTATQSVRIKNAQNIELLMHTGALNSAAAIARFATYESQEQANEAKANFNDAIDSVSTRLADAGWDDSWREINSVAAAINRDINERIGRLPYTLSVKPRAPSSSLVLSNRIYGDSPSSILGQAGDLIKRNKIRHPGFVPSEKLEVLVNAA